MVREIIKLKQVLVEITCLTLHSFNQVKGLKLNPANMVVNHAVVLRLLARECLVKHVALDVIRILRSPHNFSLHF